jgi:hypothetical protein
MNESDKKIQITGTNTRYMVKLANGEKKETKIRAFINKTGFTQIDCPFSNQYQYVQELLQNPESEKLLNKEKQFLRAEIERKIQGYKQQDVIKKHFDNELFLDLYTVLEKIVSQQMKCFYCDKETLVLYDNVRELCQWTVDRIDNKKGHNKDNFVIACLQCNLNRRQRSYDKYLFSQQIRDVQKI